jgi:uncharacterized protein (TIGR02453 family)
VTFAGFPEQALDLYEGLEADNSKAYWTDHRTTYAQAVKAPFEVLLEELEPEFGPGKLFRPYRDFRFSGRSGADRTPYKEHAGAVITGQPGDGGLYVQLSAAGLMVAGGYWRTTTAQARRLRAAVADDATGPSLVRALDALTAAGFQTGGDRLKRLPKPWDEVHPRAALLTLKSLTATRSWAPAEWLHTPACKQRVVDGWRALAPLNAWLRERVGADTGSVDVTA